MLFGSACPQDRLCLLEGDVTKARGWTQAHLGPGKACPYIVSEHSAHRYAPRRGGHRSNVMRGRPCGAAHGILLAGPGMLVEGGRMRPACILIDRICHPSYR